MATPGVHKRPPWYSFVVAWPRDLCATMATPLRGTISWRPRGRADIGFNVELLVYARHHGLPGGKSLVGISIGESPQVEELEAGAPTSYLEVRVRADAPDLLTEITLLVTKALAARGVPGRHRELAYDGVRGSVRLLPEPGFDSSRSICRTILPVLAHCRVHRDTLTTAPVSAV